MTGDSYRDFLRWTRDSRPRETLVDEATAKKSGEDESQRRATGDEGKMTSVHSKVGRGLRERFDEGRDKRCYSR